MPASDNITVPYISTILQSLRPSSALDIGIGMGKFSFFFREACEWVQVFKDGTDCVKKENWRSHLDGIEVCKEYITPLQEYLYNKIYIGPAQKIVTELCSYDLIHIGDVIEHFEKSEGQQLLDTLFEKARLGVLIVTPVGEYEQDGTKDNPYEKHLSEWSPEDLHRFPFVWSRKVGKRQWVIFISRQRYWLCDPIKYGGAQKRLLKINTRQQKLKRICNLLVGDKGLDFLIRIKRYCEGWRENR